MRTGVLIAHSVCGVPKPYSRLTTVKLVGNWWGLHGCSIWEHYLTHPVYQWHEVEEDKGSCQDGENNHIYMYNSEYDTEGELISIPVTQAALIVSINGLSLWIRLLDTCADDSF